MFLEFPVQFFKLIEYIRFSVFIFLTLILLNKQLRCREQLLPLTGRSQLIVNPALARAGRLSIETRTSLYGRREKYLCIQFPSKKQPGNHQYQFFWRIRSFLGVFFDEFHWLFLSRIAKKKKCFRNVEKLETIIKEKLKYP